MDKRGTPVRPLKKREQKEVDKCLEKDQKISYGSWTLDEQNRFVEAVRKHGKNWKLIESEVGTRTRPLISSYAQNLRRALKKFGSKHPYYDLLTILDPPLRRGQYLGKELKDDFEWSEDDTELFKQAVRKVGRDWPKVHSILKKKSNNKRTL